MLGKCKMSGRKQMFPCSAAWCPLFGDCLTEYEKEHKKNTAKPRTNADRIRAMSDEELARFLAENEWECETYNDCAKCPRMTDDGCASLLKWLKQPEEERR